MKCPTCQSEMQTSLVQGTEIDVCDAHGVWLDKGELHRIVGGMAQRHVSTLRRARPDHRPVGKYLGIFRGWAGLFGS